MARDDAEDPGAGSGALCLNCDTALIGPHCHGCGQKRDPHRTLRGFGHDLLHGVLHFEGAIWRTLPRLAWRPGRLTREYIEGARRRYVGPIPVFLFVVFVTYIGFRMLAPPATMPAAAEPDAIEGYSDSLVTIDRRIEDAASAEERAALREERDEIVTVGRLMGIDEERVTDGSGPTEPETHSGGLLAGLADGLMDDASNPALIAYKLQTNAYKFAWALIPLSAPFIWLLFVWKRRFRMYDHVVFVSYSIAFMTALSGVSALLIAYLSESIGGLLLLYAPFHLYRHLRGAYGLSRFSAGWRLVVVSAFIWLVIVLFVGLLGISAVG